MNGRRDRGGLGAVVDGVTGAWDGASTAVDNARQTGRSARLEARRRVVGIAAAVRGDRPAPLWPMALGALGAGIGIGMAAGIAAGRAMHRTTDENTQGEAVPPPAKVRLNGSPSTGAHGHGQTPPGVEEERRGPARPRHR